MYTYNAQAEQDKFVLHVLQHKENGYFLEIGSICYKNSVVGVFAISLIHYSIALIFKKSYEMKIKLSF